MSKIVYIGAMHPQNLECMREDQFARIYKALRAGPDAPDYMVNHGSAAAKPHLEKLRDAFSAAGFAVGDPGLPKTALSVTVPATDAGTDACRMNWFREKHARFRELAENTDLKTFACDTGVVLDMKTALSDDRGDAVWLWTGCDPRLYPLDELVRKLHAGTAFYFMDRTVYVHN